MVTPPAGFEPATNRLTVDGSTAELQRNELTLEDRYLKRTPQCLQRRSLHHGERVVAHSLEGMVSVVRRLRSNATSSCLHNTKD